MKSKLIKLLILVIILEVVIFNYKAYRNLNSSNKRMFKEEDFSCYESNEKYTYIEIDNINDEIKTFYINISNAKVVEYQLLYTDETSSEFREVAPKTYVQGIENSKYIDTYLSGKSNKIAIRIFAPNINVEEICINDKIPFNFSLVRFICVYLFLVFLCVVREYDIFKSTIANFNYKHECILLVVLAIFCMLIFYININSRKEQKNDYYSYDFVDALAKGQSYIDKEPEKELVEMQNPYDNVQRNEKGLRRNDDYIWDIALYNGKYYVYFGVLPALILLVPYHIITGQYLSTATAILLFSILAAISLKELIYNIFNRYFKNVSFKVMLYSFLILLFGSQILILNGTPRFYELAVISGLFFAIIGINFLFIAIKSDEINYKYIFLTSLFLSLAVACRPTMLLVSLIALPVFFNTFLENIKYKKNIGKIIFAVCPYIIVGTALMYYNYIRFDNILEFGASYQLTLNDMSKLRNRFMTIGIGVMSNLFNVPILKDSFPFVQNSNVIPTFYGYYYIENMVGGLFMLVPICFSIFGLYKLYNKEKKDEDLNKTILIFTLVGILICIVSIMMAGSTPRYLADYAWILIIAGIMTFVANWNNCETVEAKQILERILGFMVVYIILINFCAGIVSEKENFKINSPKNYYKLKYVVDFWE